MKLKKHISRQELARACVGTVLGIGSIALLAEYTNLTFIIAPFGASAVLLYSAASSPLAQPRNLIIGHLASGAIAITVCNLFGSTVFSTVLTVTAAIIVMLCLDAVHPPGGATALLCILQGTTDYMFLLVPLASGIIILLLTAFIVSALFPDASPYPASKKRDG